MVISFQDSVAHLHRSYRAGEQLRRVNRTKHSTAVAHDNDEKPVFQIESSKYCFFVGPSRAFEPVLLEEKVLEIQYGSIKRTFPNKVIFFVEATIDIY